LQFLHALKGRDLNLYTESTNTVPNVKLDSGSTETAIMNLHAQSDGSAIYDFSGGEYDAYNAGYPDSNSFRKTAITGNDSEAGPDGDDFQLGGPNDYVTLLCNGAEWFITASNRMAGNTRYADTSGTYQIDMAVDTYLISSYGGAVTAQLPPANAAEAIGRTITIKKTDNSANAVTVTEQGGSGPDQSNQPLSSQYSAITVVSNGGQWYIVSKFTP
jgi:hypothetical protein